MDIAVQDRVRVRKMRHAARMTTDLQENDPAARGCLGEKLVAASNELLEAAVAAFRPDDEATQAVQAAEQDLRSTLKGTALALRRAGVAAGDEAADAMDALVESVFPHGRVDAVRSGPPLQQASEALVGALRDSYPDLASAIDDVAARYAEAIEAANARVEEIDPAELRRIKARAEADRWLRAARAFVTFKVESDPGCGVAFEDVWPVGDEGSWDAQNAALDDCGVPEPEDEEPQDEPAEDDEDEG